MSDRRMRLGPGELASCLTSARLHLILLPTEACNFRCVYCYESFRQGRMKPWVVTAVKRLIDRRAEDLQELALSWFGGEPLLAAGVIEDVMGHVRSWRERLPTLGVAADITTNGYLLSPKLARRLLELGVTEYQISFDGPRVLHDRKRIRVGGRGTYDRIWENLRSLRSMDAPFRVMIRLHVDRELEPMAPAILDAIASEFGADPRFELFVRTLGRFGGPLDETLPTFATEEEGQAAVERIRAQATARGLRLRDPPPGAEICYATRGNSFVVRADGTLNKCTIALEHPGNHVGTLREDGTLQIERERILPWLRGLSTGDEEALLCPMRGLADRAAGSDVGAPMR